VPKHEAEEKEMWESEAAIVAEKRVMIVERRAAR
jgi:hypothetical protein